MGTDKEFDMLDIKMFKIEDIGQNQSRSHNSLNSKSNIYEIFSIR